MKVAVISQVYEDNANRVHKRVLAVVTEDRVAVAKQALLKRNKEVGDIRKSAEQ